jgi:hypothetical protein
MRPAGRRARNGSAWLAGLVVGVAGGVLFWTFPTLGVLILALFVVPVLLRRGPIVGLAGPLVGAGGSSLVVLISSLVRCDRFDAAPNQECTQPDLGPWLIGAAFVLLAGIALSVSAVWRRAGDGS